MTRELAELTPGPYLHVGGDEALSTTSADYLEFERRVLPMVREHGKIPYGWQEIAQAPEASDAVLQYWNHQGDPRPVAAAVAAGAKVVLSPANRAYLDQQYEMFSPHGLEWAGSIEVRTAYDWNPGRLLPGVPEKAVLGVEAPLWSETLRDREDIEYLAFPRLVAIAELGWSPRRDWASFRARLGAYGPRWIRQGLDFYPSPQIPWT